MSKVVEYVGFFHLLRDHVKETWTQFRANLSTTPTERNEAEGSANESEVNFRSKVKVKLERLRQQSIRTIDNSSTDQDDYSHLTRPKTRKELMQISAAVMGIEFSYAAETAFVSPLLLNIGLRHRHMTLIWCLSPLLGLFITPILGSLSDGCRSQLGRRRPFIILLSIGIVLGLILVPNGKTIGRMLGDTYSDDELPKNPSELSAHLLMTPQFSTSQTASTGQETLSPFTETSVLTEHASDSKDLSNWRKNSAYSTDTTLENSTFLGGGEIPPEEEPRLYYKTHTSKYAPSEYDGYRAWNSLSYKDQDVEQKEFFKNLARKDKSRKMNQEELEHLVRQATLDGDNENDEETLADNFTDTNGGEPNNILAKDSKSPFKVDAFAEAKMETERSTRFKRLETSAEKASANNGKSSNFDSGSEDAVKSHPWGLVFTVIGTVLLDFDADACQSPSRAYMLDVTIPEDHAKGLSTFTIMAGLGGSIGYFLGALNWENTFLGHLFGGHVRAVFTLVLFIFIACVIATIRSFKEIPMDRLWANKPAGGGFDTATNSGHAVGCQSKESKPKNNPHHVDKHYARLEDDSEASNAQCDDHSAITQTQKSYGAIQETSFNAVSGQGGQNPSSLESGVEQAPTFREYVKTIVQLPRSLQWLCVTNFFCWMSLVCYSLYFTDFVGEAVFGGDPTAPRGSPLKEKYDEGVRFGCWGMSLYSLSCSIYSLCIESLVNRFGARRVYIYGQLVYSVGMVLMALARHPAGVIIFSWTAGIMYATLFTMPYLLVARYHAAETFDVDVDDMMEKPSQMRGLGTDVAIVSSMVFLAQITQALTLGTIVTMVGSTTAIVCAAAVFAACGALCARKVLYLDL